MEHVLLERDAVILSLSSQVSPITLHNIKLDIMKLKPTTLLRVVQDWYPHDASITTSVNASIRISIARLCLCACHRTGQLCRHGCIGQTFVIWHMTSLMVELSFHRGNP